MLAKVFNVSLDRLILGTNDFNQPLVKLNNIVKTFNTPVLNNLDLTIHNNERIALLGSNGAGKTTLVKIIEGALKPNEGTIKWYFNKNNSLNINLNYHPSKIQLLRNYQVDKNVAFRSYLAFSVSPSF